MSRNALKHHPRKRFGQNFLHDDGVIRDIVRAVCAVETDHIVEIGPGEGALTNELLDTGCTLDAIELDRDLKAYLLSSFAMTRTFTLHSADALQFDFSSLIVHHNQCETRPKLLRVVGNLPYNISTTLLFKLLASLDLIKDMHLMLQLEVAERLAATPGNKKWGRLGVMAQLSCRVEHLFDVSPKAFRPAPKVQSALVRLTPWELSPYPKVDKSAVTRIVKRAFSHRRKTLRNNFKGTFTDQDFEAMRINPDARAETLRIEDFITIATHQG